MLFSGWVISQPTAFSTTGQTVQTERNQIEIRQDKGSLSIVKQFHRITATIAAPVKNCVQAGASPSSHRTA